MGEVEVTLSTRWQFIAGPLEEVKRTPQRTNADKRGSLKRKEKGTRPGFNLIALRRRC